ncbi:hypothetical protein FE782_12560 [Paenibacillus antri]|uniref:YqzN/YkzM domain-containing protein n=1 Tax=Paenibacillus antri TaxID=2582848 RepID=A0A5R9G5U9_9BACL|nr:hypothetical protein [Paenibacillus antri]TLS51742.1 hypothetical protein FE782_12560 [Paenibacillus antri]
MGKQRNNDVDAQPAEAPEPSASTASAEENRKPAKPAEKRFTAASLRSHARQLFGVNPETVDGALHGAGAGEFTVKEAQAKIKAFLKREVK